MGSGDASINETQKLRIEERGRQKEGAAVCPPSNTTARTLPSTSRCPF